jgi:hypothetical protein
MFIKNKQGVKDYQVDFYLLLMYWIISVVVPLHFILLHGNIFLMWIEFITAL